MTGSLPETTPQGIAFERAWAERPTALKAQPHVWWKLQSEKSAAECSRAGLPTPRLEEWKYFNIKSALVGARKPAQVPVNVKGPKGITVRRLSQLSPVEAQGIQLKIEDRVENYFARLVSSLIVDPFVIEVPAGLVADVPIELDWGHLPANHWGLGLAIVTVGDGAEVALLERYGLLSDSTQKGSTESQCDAFSFATIVDVGPRSRLAHLRVHHGEGVKIVTGSPHTRVMAHGNYQSVQLAFGSELGREDLTVELCGADAEATVDGLFVARRGQVIDNHTTIRHRVGQTISRQNYKGIVSEDGRGVFNGKIHIAHGASGSNAEQLNKNLLLSAQSEVDTKPELQIENDDVKATHGATIGRPDAEQIFYLQTRGIPTAQAIEILSRGFAFDCLARLGSPSLVKTGSELIATAVQGIRWESKQ